MELMQPTRPYARNARYNSLAELVTDAMTCNRKSDTTKQWTYGSFQSLNGAIRAIELGKSSALVRHYTREAADRLELAMDAAETLGLSRRRRRVWSDQGDPDTDRVLDRRELWAGESRPGAPARIVRIGINVWISCHNEEKDFAGLAGTACAIADKLNKLGYAAEIIGILAAAHWDKREEHFAYSWPMKSAHEPLDIERVGTIGCPAIMRHFGFNLYARDFNRPNEHAFGYCTTEPAALRVTTGVDYLLARSWSNDYQDTIAEGIRQIIEAA